MSGEESSSWHPDEKVQNGDDAIGIQAEYTEQLMQYVSTFRILQPFFSLNF
jgi:hypothetical protein